MTLVFLLEEFSMKVFLEPLLPRILPEGVESLLISHEGKKDLEKSIPRKLRAWPKDGTQFIVVRDQDSGDCRAIKRHLASLCAQAGRPALVRIACRELEAWFLGDLAAVAEAFKKPKLARLQNKRKFRLPDTLHKPSVELAKLVPDYGKVSGARAMGPVIRVDGGSSPSFQAFVRGIRKLAK